MTQTPNEPAKPEAPVKPKRSKRPGEGRPSKYDPKYCKELVEYFDVPHTFEREIVHTNSKSGAEWTDVKDVPNPIRFLADFASSIGTNRQRLYEWAKIHPEFQDALTRAKELREQMVASLALRGLYNPMFAMFYLKNRYEDRYKEKSELDIKKKNEATYRDEIAKMRKKALELLNNSKARQK
jgi:hypothetical protein